MGPVPPYNPNIPPMQQQLEQLQRSYAQMMQQNVMTGQPVGQRKALDFVKGIEGAEKFYDNLLPGDSWVVWDDANPVFYMLTKDANGNPATVQIGDFTIKPAPTMDDKYVTKDDFNAFAAEIRQYMAQNKEAVNNG